MTDRSDTVLAMDESSQAAVILPTEIPEPSRPLKRKISHQSTAAFSAFLRTPLGSGSDIEFLNSLIQRTMTHRQQAEIQLQSLLNEPEESLPTFTRRASDHLGNEKLSIEEVSKLLNTQPFIIERLIYALYSSTDDEENIKTISKIEVQKLTRILNRTIDVRAFLFFMMLGENKDYYITNNELRDFYKKHLKCLKTFDDNRLQEIIQVLLQKFHLDQVNKKRF